MTCDYLIVGSGLTGATIARVLSDAHFNVLVIDRRSHIGGNVFDYIHPSGLRINKYGPHYFRTNSDQIWKFVNRFATFYNYTPTIKTMIDGQYETWPPSINYIEEMCGKDWISKLPHLSTNFELNCLTKMPIEIYNKFVRDYTIKQWGVSPIHLSSSLSHRINILKSSRQSIFAKKYQGMPVNGYTNMLHNILQDIPRLLNCDYFAIKNISIKRGTIFTGSIDELFNYDIGRLNYRTQLRQDVLIKSTKFIQPCGQVNYPSAKVSHIRSLEWKHMMQLSDQVKIKDTIITHETPTDAVLSDQNEYPFPDEKNNNLYADYRIRASKIPNLTICGRLGDYKYYDMDVAIGKAIKIANSILLQ